MENPDFHIITDEQAGAFEKTAHNPPLYSESFTPEEFSQEWEAVREALSRRLGLLGEEWQLSRDEGDYLLSESRGDSRWIYITFTSTRLWRPEFVFAVVDFLRGLPTDYRVCCLTELSAEEFLDYPLVYLLISSRDVFGNALQACVDDKGSVAWIECNDELQKFGFPRGADSVE